MENLTHGPIFDAAWELNAVYGRGTLMRLFPVKDVPNLYMAEVLLQYGTSKFQVRVVTSGGRQTVLARGHQKRIV